MNLNSPITRLRIISLLDAISFLYLIYCSLYLKRVLGDASAIKVPGMIHGVLFGIFCLALLDAWRYKNWSFKTVTLVFLTCLIPLVPFWLEGWLKKQDQENNSDDDDLILRAENKSDPSNPKT